MKKNMQLVGTLLAASLLAAGSASAQTTNTTTNPPPRGFLGSTLGMVGLGGVAQRIRSPNTYSPAVAALRGGLLGGRARPVARTNGGAASGTNPSTSMDDSLPGLVEADQQMREEGAGTDTAMSGDANPSEPNTSDTGSDVEADADGGTADADDGMSGPGTSRTTTSSHRRSSDYRGNRQQDSRIFSVGFQIGRTDTHTTEQQANRNSRSDSSNSQSQYSPPPSGQDAEGDADGTGESASASDESSTPSGSSSTGSEAAP